jgi:hypothetical protein
MIQNCYAFFVECVDLAPDSGHGLFPSQKILPINIQNLAD